MKRLILLRHGKADWDVDHDDDHARPLNDRGVASAKTMGRLLTSAGEEPDLIITSSATRAVMTAQLAKEAGGWACPIEATGDLYNTSTTGAMDVIGAVDESVERLLIVGHDPTWTELATRLTGGRVGMATATAAGIDIESDSWRDIDVGEVVFLLPPGLFGWVGDG